MHNIGKYEADNLELRPLQEKLQRLYQPSLNRLRDEFGIELGDL